MLSAPRICSRRAALPIYSAVRRCRGPGPSAEPWPSQGANRTPWQRLPVPPTRPPTRPPGSTVPARPRRARKARPEMRAIRSQGSRHILQPLWENEQNEPSSSRGRNGPVPHGGDSLWCVRGAEGGDRKNPGEEARTRRTGAPGTENNRRALTRPSWCALRWPGGRKTPASLYNNLTPTPRGILVQRESFLQAWEGADR